MSDILLPTGLKKSRKKSKTARTLKVDSKKPKVAKPPKINAPITRKQILKSLSILLDLTAVVYHKKIEVSADEELNNFFYYVRSGSLLKHEEKYLKSFLSATEDYFEQDYQFLKNRFGEIQLQEACFKFLSEIYAELNNENIDFNTYAIKTKNFFKKQKISESFLSTFIIDLEEIKYRGGPVQAAIFTIHEYLKADKSKAVVVGIAPASIRKNIKDVEKYSPSLFPGKFNLRFTSNRLAWLIRKVFKVQKTDLPELINQLNEDLSTVYTSRYY